MPLQDKLVLVGVNFSDAPDFIEHPTLGAVPGVFLHAMALDNLMTYGSDYPKHGESGGFLEAATLLLGLVTVVLATAVSRLYWRRHRFRSNESFWLHGHFWRMQVRHLLAFTLAFIVCSAVVVVIASLCYAYGRLPSDDALAVLAALGIIPAAWAAQHDCALGEFERGKT
jgi:CHASE2 domain-containing sensor protein